MLKAAGIKALEAHTIGCLIIEEDFEGRVFVRDITFNATTGEPYDLDINVLDGLVWSTDDVRRHLGIPGPVIAWGDIHEDHLNEDCARVACGSPRDRPGIGTAFLEASVDVATAPGLTRGMTVVDPSGSLGTPRARLLRSADLVRVAALFGSSLRIRR